MFKQNVLKYFHVKIPSPEAGYSDVRLISGVQNVVCYCNYVVIQKTWLGWGRGSAYKCKEPCAVEFGHFKNALRGQRADLGPRGRNRAGWYQRSHEYKVREL